MLVLFTSRLDGDWSAEMILSHNRSLVACRTVSICKGAMQHLVQQAFVFRSVRFMTAYAIRAGNRDPAVGIDHGRSFDIMTSLAQAGSPNREQVFNIGIVGGMAFQTFTVFCWRVLMLVFLDMKSQISVA